MGMLAAKLTEEDGRRAQALWAEYQQAHDVSDRIGQTVGVEPESGAMWFGESIVDVVDQRNAAGVHRLLFFIRAGYDAYYRKGARG
jgi:hypothetical protein